MHAESRNSQKYCSSKIWSYTVSALYIKALLILDIHFVSKSKDIQRQENLFLAAMLANFNRMLVLLLLLIRERFLKVYAYREMFKSKF